ncbi:MAG TPA: ABC transporter ATP-binding protein [Nocardioides sp.]|nr:ABC transporter ATP-binding protein [Nocardioides sp.]
MSALLEVQGLVKRFPAGGPVWRRRYVHAVSDVDLSIGRGQTLGLVGESGSGKTTVGRCILGLYRPDEGLVRFDGRDVAGLRGSTLAEFRRRVQPVFQDPYGSLDPRWTVGRSVQESLEAHRIGSVQDRRDRVRELFATVGLDPALGDRHPRNLSGGQRQRVGIAAALASEPELIIADEPVSALDVSVQAQIINLLQRLGRDLGLAVLFISHDLGVVEHVSSEVAVMYLGRVVETGPTAAILRAPEHPYTRALVEAIPHPDPSRRFRHASLAGEIPSPVDPPSGCAFHPRCPIAQASCRIQVPELEPVGEDHLAACPVVARVTTRPTT